MFCNTIKQTCRWSGRWLHQNTPIRDIPRIKDRSLCTKVSVIYSESPLYSKSHYTYSKISLSQSPIVIGQELQLVDGCLTKWPCAIYTSDIMVAAVLTVHLHVTCACVYDIVYKKCHSCNTSYTQCNTCMYCPKITCTCNCRSQRSLFAIVIIKWWTPRERDSLSLPNEIRKERKWKRLMLTLNHWENTVSINHERYVQQ